MLNSILIIDDSEADVNYARRILEYMGKEYSVFSCKNGEEGLAFFEDYEEKRKQYGDDYPPLLILLDINMPIMNGWDFLKEYNAKYGNDSRFESIVFRKYLINNWADKNKALEYPFVEGYVVKPLDEKSINSIIEKHFSS